MWTAITVSLIFTLLSALHWYWVFGGQFGLNAALPSADGKRVLNPGPALTALVALLLLIAAAICLAQAELAGLSRSIFTQIGVGGLASAFALRAIGDFRLVGIFKRVKGTPFARMDTKFFTPLCILVSAMCAMMLL